MPLINNIKNLRKMNDDHSQMSNANLNQNGAVQIHENAEHVLNENQNEEKKENAQIETDNKHLPLVIAGGIFSMVLKIISSSVIMAKSHKNYKFHFQEKNTLFDIGNNTYQIIDASVALSWVVQSFIFILFLVYLYCKEGDCRKIRDIIKNNPLEKEEVKYYLLYDYVSSIVIEIAILSMIFTLHHRTGDTQLLTEEFKISPFGKYMDTLDYMVDSIVPLKDEEEIKLEEKAYGLYIENLNAKDLITYWEKIEIRHGCLGIDCSLKIIKNLRHTTCAFGVLHVFILAFNLVNFCIVIGLSGIIEVCKDIKEYVIDHIFKKIDEGGPFGTILIISLFFKLVSCFCRAGNDALKLYKVDLSGNAHFGSGAYKIMSNGYWFMLAPLLLSIIVFIIMKIYTYFNSTNKENFSAFNIRELFVDNRRIFMLFIGIFIILDIVFIALSSHIINISKSGSSHKYISPFGKYHDEAILLINNITEKIDNVYDIEDLVNHLPEIKEIITEIKESNKEVLSNVDIQNFIIFLHNVEILRECSGELCIREIEKYAGSKFKSELIMAILTLITDILSFIIGLITEGAFKVKKENDLVEYFNNENLVNKGIGNYDSKNTEKEKQCFCEVWLNKVIIFFKGKPKEAKEEEIKDIRKKDYEFLSLLNKKKPEALGYLYYYTTNNGYTAINKRLFKCQINTQVHIGQELPQGNLVDQISAITVNHGHPPNLNKDKKEETKEEHKEEHKEEEANTDLEEQNIEDWVINVSKKTTHVDGQDLEKCIQLITMTIHACPLRMTLVLHRYSDLNTFITYLKCKYEKENDDTITKYSQFSEDQIKELKSKLRENQMVGEKILHLGFLSTSLDENVEGFGNKSIHLKITATKYTRGIYIRSISKFPKENEVLVQRGQIMEITSSAFDPNKKLTDMRFNNQPGLKDNEAFDVDVKLIDIEPEEVKSMHIMAGK